MEWYIISSLISIGLLLLVVEVIFIPGTSVAGFIGFALMITGIILSFSYFDSSTGWIVLGSTAVVSGIVFYWTFRSKPWKQFSLKSTIDGKVNEGILDGLEVGEEGLAISALRPIGKADVGGKIVEVSSLGTYVDSGTRIRIIKISLNQIVVEPLN